MKKILMIVAVMALVSMASFAQTKFGVKAGVNFAGLSGDDFEGTDGRTSMVFGGFAEFKLADKFAFQPELLYSMQGATGSEQMEGVDVDLTMKLDYLNVPLMAKFFLADGFSLQAGPQVGILLSAKVKAEASGIDVEEDVKEEFKSVDFGFNFGFGYEMENGLGFGARYNLGLSDVADWEDADGKNGVFQLTLGYAF